MPRVSKRKKIENTQPQCRYYRTYIYLRLSEKDGGHGRKDSIYIQKQICIDHAKKHPELLVMKTFMDNGVTGTNFERKGFEQLMEAVRGGKVDCIIVKDFSRFGRDALDAVDLIDTIFPRLGVRFISVLDQYDSENPACTNERVNNILKHFMNDYYAREVSEKLVQAHKLSREKGEYWGSRPPYGFERSAENSKALVPEPVEREIIRKIFYWYVFEGMSSYEIARELNATHVLVPSESYDIRHYGESKNKRKIYWTSECIRRLLQNPVYIGAAVFGKTKQMLSKNIPLHMIPKEQWEIKENVWDALVEKSVFEEAQKIGVQRWKDYLPKWSSKMDENRCANGPLLGHIYCGCCGRRLTRSRKFCDESQVRFEYRCRTSMFTKEPGCVTVLREKYVMEALSSALKTQIQLAIDFQQRYGMEFYSSLKRETDQNVKHAREKYEGYGRRLEQLFEHYATGILDKDEYLEIKNTYQTERAQAHDTLISVQNHSHEILDRMRAKMDWAEALVRYQHFTEVNREMVECFIDKVIVRSAFEITVIFWFGDIFDQEISQSERGDSYAV